MLELIDKDQMEFIRGLRRNNYLIDWNHRFRRRQGLVLVACPDPDHSHDLLTHQFKVNERILPLTEYGGACLLGMRKWITDPTVEVFKQKLMFAFELAEQPPTVVLMAHFPCKWANLHNLKVDEQLGMLEEAARRVAEIFRQAGNVKPEFKNKDLEVVKMLHVFDGTKRRSYLLNPHDSK